jgi:hypothetical protein
MSLLIGDDRWLLVGSSKLQMWEPVLQRERRLSISCPFAGDVAEPKNSWELGPRALGSRLAFCASQPRWWAEENNCAFQASGPVCGKVGTEKKRASFELSGKAVWAQLWSGTPGRSGGLQWTEPLCRCRRRMNPDAVPFVPCFHRGL